MQAEWKTSKTGRSGKALRELGFHESEQKEHSVKKRKCERVTSDSKAAHKLKSVEQGPDRDL